MHLDADDPWINEDDILERVDEYTLYCHYLGFEPQLGMKYTSPIRVRADQYDDFASFGMFTSRTKKCVEYMWKDQGLGIHGDIFDLVRHLFPEITTRQDSRLRHHQRIENVRTHTGDHSSAQEGIRHTREVTAVR
jgi:hypothetical protein